MRPYLATWPASPLAVATVRTYGAGALLYGLTIILQGPERWTGPQFAIATALAPSWAWGAIVACFGALILLGSWSAAFGLRNVGLYGVAVWLLFLAGTIVVAGAEQPRVSVSGAVLYAAVAFALVIVARAREIRP